MAGGYSGDKIPKGYELGQVSNYTRQQSKLHKNQFQHLGPDSFLSRLASGDQEMFNEIEAPAMKQFNALQGGTASRFSNMGMGARRSSGFQNTTNQASSDFAAQLQSNRLDLRNKALHDLMDMSNQLLNQRPYERDLFQKPQKQDKGALGGWGPTLGAIGGGAAGFFGSGGNPAAAYSGAKFGSGVLSGL